MQIGIDIEEVERFPNRDQHKAGQWVAKEAIFKATGEWKEIKYTKEGKPYADGVVLSISHTRKYAVAVAVKL